MIPDLDIRRAAHALVKRYGPDATLEASSRANELIWAGDVEGVAIWGAIIRAIEELQRTRRADETVQ